MRKWHYFFTLMVLLLSTATTWATDPIRDPQQLWQAKQEKVLHVTTAKVIVADYDLIRLDFPEVKDWTIAQIDEWLIRNTAFVSKQQAAQQVVNDRILLDGTNRTAYRPREYRRAHVFVVDTGGLIDAKGTGSVDPSGGSHENGLATLGDMLREFAFEKLVHALFNRDGRMDTVGSYAVIDFGFNIKHPGGGHSRAGTILRQAHTRYHDGPMKNRGPGEPTMLPRELQLKMEFFLRQFGITSAIKSWNGGEYVNIQGDTLGSLIDFGSFLVEDTFSKEVAFYYNIQGAYGGEVITGPKKANFVQPDSNLKIPFEIWGYSQTGKADSKYDNVYIWSHELAEAIAEGRATRQDVEDHLRNLFDNDRVQLVLKNTPRACEKIF